MVQPPIRQCDCIEITMVSFSIRLGILAEIPVCFMTNSIDEQALHALVTSAIHIPTWS